MARGQNPKIERTLRRTSSLRLVKQTFLIVCEGEVTEPEYFNSFRLTSANVKAIGKGMNTISLVKEAIAVRDIEKRRNRNYDQCWVVFDKDDFLTAISTLPYRWHRLMVFMWHIATKHLNIGSCYISTYIKDPYTEVAMVRCFPTCLASDTVRQKATP